MVVFFREVQVVEAQGWIALLLPCDLKHRNRDRNRDRVTRLITLFYNLLCEKLIKILICMQVDTICFLKYFTDGDGERSRHIG